MKILMTGDLHMGRGSSKFSEMESQTSIGCWQAIVEEALNRSVDLVLLSGDVVDRKNCYFESYMPLQTGIARLANNGVTTIAVAGNHDFSVLPNLTNDIDKKMFRLLGLGGVWEQFEFECDGKTLGITGWSFPESHVEITPLDSFPDVINSCDYHIAMVHGDLNATVSKYAPLSLSRIDELSDYHWLLGHVHKPQLTHTQNERWVLYPGSPQALDPGEPHHHGVWLWEPGQKAEPEMLPMSSVCYEPLTIDVSNCGDADEIVGYVIREIKNNAESLKNAAHQRMRAVNYRINIIGECDNPAEVEKELLSQSRNLPFEDVQTSVEHLRFNVLPRLDKAELRVQKTVLARAFNLLESLEAGDYNAEIEQLLRQIQQRCSQHAGRYHSIDTAHELQHAEIVNIAKNQLTQIVSDLRSQPDA
ncbi:MAG: DNA repair exonuclease [Planctomycetaceae bacterium]|jgi:DNA repair protein SbcD/Mre11|nr:DNA repair exonuclease [Planctomycetaceae bacterium]